jgi:LuxR family maltose regulon positive regulatory protein
MSVPIGPAEGRATVLRTKLSPGVHRPGAVVRTNLIRRIDAGPERAIVVCAPVGYGKTTLLAQCAATIDRPVAWLSLDPSDNDPSRLLTEIASAIDRIIPIDPLVFDGLSKDPTEIDGEVLPRLERSLAVGPRLVIILDDVHLVRASRCIDALVHVGARLPAGAKFVLAAREVPALLLERLRAATSVLELSAADLALTADEAHQLLRAEGVTIDADALEHLVRRSDGWAAGIYLAALAAVDAVDPSSAVRDFGGDDRNVIDYLTGELLTGQPAARVDFLLRSSVLERLSPALCDAVLDRQNSRSMLVELEQANHLLIPVDEHPGWYRFHHLFREALGAVLAHHEGSLVPALHQRASRWYEQCGHMEQAIEHALQAGDPTGAARMLANQLGALLDRGRQAAIRHWLQALPDVDLGRYPALVAAATWDMALRGDRSETRRYLGLLRGPAVDRPLELAQLRAILAWDGVAQMQGHAELACELDRSAALSALGLGANLMLRGRPAQAPLREAVTKPVGAGSASAFAAALLTLAQLEAGEWAEAGAGVIDGLALVQRLGLHETCASAGLFAAQAAIAARHGEHDVARGHLATAISLLPRATTIPWWSMYLLVVNGRVALELGDLTRSASLLHQARNQLARYPDAGVLPALLGKQERALEAARGGAGVLGEPLSEAELRILELMPTHLTLEEIGRRLCISRNTVKTHLKDIYARLRVSSRSETVARAEALGLIGRH